MVALRHLIRAVFLGLVLGWSAMSAVAQDARLGDSGRFVENDLWVIAHPDVPAQDLTERQLRTILLGNQRFWPGGERIHLVIDGQAGGLARRAWIEDLTNMTEVQYAQYWIGMVFRGRAITAPHAATDTALATGLVAALPGSISIVEGEPTSEGVQVLGALDDIMSQR